MAKSRKPIDIRGIHEGVIVKWRETDKFGVVRVSRTGQPSVSVLIDEDACMEVTGTAEQPIITNRRVPIYVKPSGRDRTRVILDVVHGQNGLKAAVWGIAPSST
jgi:hypothetical protein